MPARASTAASTRTAEVVAVYARCVDARAKVSPIVMAVAAYAIVLFEDDVRHDHERWWWMQMAAIQVGFDQRVGVDLVSVIRAAKLLSGRTAP